MENELVGSPIEEQSPDGDGFAETPEGSPVVAVEAPKKRRRKKSEAPVVEDGHCPACSKGQPITEGSHILGTHEHPIPVAPPVPEKTKHIARAMHKELRGAASFAEKMLPKKIAEKAKAVAEVARLEAEIQELVRVIQALGGQMPVGMPAPASYIPQPVSMATIMSDQPLYPQAPNVATMMPVSRAGGGAMDVAMAPVDEIPEDQFLTERSALTGGGGWL